ncbi:CoA transferase [Alcaligenaceae bacterium]|nr:CoA transferase [Alcaligenaceae bacterium]
MLEQNDPADRPLSGVRVLDLSTVIFGPYASMILADYGAEVIKVESPQGDPTRYIGPADEAGMAAIFLGVNRNKKSVVLDLKTEPGLAALHALIDTADVLMHNIRPQKLPALGLEAEPLLQRNGRLVHVSLNGFGGNGVYAGQPAYDDIVQGLSGASALMRGQTGAPGYLPMVMADKIGALTAVHAILAAVIRRDRTGRGQIVEVPLFESMTACVLVEHYFGGHLPQSAQGMGYSRLLSSDRRPFPTRDGYVCMMPYSDADWRRFFTNSGFPGHAKDPRFQSLRLRTQHTDALYAVAGEILRTRETAYWLEKLPAWDIPASRVNSLEDLENDPHLRSVDFFQDLPDGNGGAYRYPRSPMHIEGVHVPLMRPPRLGEHTDEILRTTGLSDALMQENGISPISNHHDPT